MPKYIRQLNISICKYFTNTLIKGLTSFSVKAKIYIVYSKEKYLSQLKNKINSAFKNNYKSLSQSPLDALYKHEIGQYRTCKKMSIY